MSLVKVQFSASVKDLYGKPVKLPTQTGFVEPVHKAVREKLVDMGCGADMLQAFDGLVAASRDQTVGDVCCEALGNDRSGKKLTVKDIVGRLELIRKIQAAEESLTPIELDVTVLGNLSELVAAGEASPYIKGQVCEALNGNVPASE